MWTTGKSKSKKIHARAKRKSNLLEQEEARAKRKRSFLEQEENNKLLCDFRVALYENGNAI
jgi:hypothetical protein